MLSLTALKRLLPIAAAALPIVTFVSLGHAQISGVSSVEVSEDATPDFFHLAEVLAFEQGTGTNVALTGVATATSSGFGSVPADGNDGNTDGNFNNGSVWHDGDANGGTVDSFTVTFASPVTLNSIQLFGRTDCCQSRDDAIVVTLRDAAGAPLFTTATGIPNDDQELTISLAAVPEPTTFGVVGLGLAGVALRRRR